MSTLKRIIRLLSNLLFYVLIAVMILLLIYVGVVTVYKKQNRLGEIPLNFYTILTTSMVPEIQAGDIVITFKNQDNIYKEKDVVTFVSEGAMTKGVTITHRIIKTELINGDRHYYTKGDANNSADTTPVSGKNIIGKVIFKIPKAGYLQQFMVSRFGWIVVVVLPCLSIIIYDIVKIFEKMFKLKKLKEKLSYNKTKEKREELEKTINSLDVSPEVQNEIENLYESIEKNNNESEKTNLVEVENINGEEENVEEL